MVYNIFNHFFLVKLENILQNSTILTWERKVRILEGLVFPSLSSMLLMLPLSFPSSSSSKFWARDSLGLKSTFPSWGGTNGSVDIEISRKWKFLISLKSRHQTCVFSLNLSQSHHTCRMSIDSMWLFVAISWHFANWCFKSWIKIGLYPQFCCFVDKLFQLEKYKKKC